MQVATAYRSNTMSPMDLSDLEALGSKVASLVMCLLSNYMEVKGEKRYILLNETFNASTWLAIIPNASIVVVTICTAPTSSSNPQPINLMSVIYAGKHWCLSYGNTPPFKIFVCVERVKSQTLKLKQPASMPAGQYKHVPGQFMIFLACEPRNWIPSPTNPHCTSHVSNWGDLCPGTSFISSCLN